MTRSTWVQSQVELYQRLKKMVLDTFLLNTRQYKVEMKGKVEQSKERSSALTYTIEKGVFGSPSTKVANFTVSADRRVKIKENEEWDKYLDLARDHQDNGIIKVGQNNDKSPELLRRPAVTQWTF